VTLRGPSIQARSLWHYWYTLISYLKRAYSIIWITKACVYGDEWQDYVRMTEAAMPWLNITSSHVTTDMLHWKKHTNNMVGRDSVVGRAIAYGPDSPGIESGWRGDFPHAPWGPPSLLYKGYQVPFPGVKWPGRGVDHPPRFSADAKERVEL